METAELTAPQEVVKTALRDAVNKRLAECTEAQRALAARLLPKGLEALDEPALKNFLALVNRTLRSNWKG